MPAEIPSNTLSPLDRLRRVVHILRAPGGCPWDAAQTHESLIRHLLEEAYEAAQAIRSGDREEIVDELGDVLLQPVLHAEIASESGRFDLDEIARHLCEKLIRRHPHVFGDVQAETPEAVLVQWEAVKAQERRTDSSLLENQGSPSTLGKIKHDGPALIVASKIQRKAADVGFDWPEIPPVIEKVREELTEVERAIESDRSEEIAMEIGDLLFAVVNLARKAGCEAELLLDSANRKFVRRFGLVEEELKSQGKAVANASLQEMDRAWDRVKLREKSTRSG